MNSEELSFQPDATVHAVQVPIEHTKGTRVVLAGFPSQFTLRILDALLSSPSITDVGLLTSLRAGELIENNTTLATLSKTLGIPLIASATVNTPETIARITSIHADIGLGMNRGNAGNRLW